MGELEEVIECSSLSQDQREGGREAGTEGGREGGEGLVKCDIGGKGNASGKRERMSDW